MQIHINEAFWSAWQKYNWAKGVWGVGLNKKKVEEAISKKENLEITVGKDTKKYLVSPKIVKSFAEKNKWFFVTKGVELYIFPHNLMSKI